MTRNIIASFSGGRTSAVMCEVLKGIYGDKVNFVFMDTGAEHPKTYDFVRNVDVYLGLDLVCLRGNFNQPLGKGLEVDVVPVAEVKQDLFSFRSAVMKYGTPTISGAWCSPRMKELVHDKYCDSVYGRKNYETWLGIRADEPKRFLGANLFNELSRLGVVDGDELPALLVCIANYGASAVKWFYPALSGTKNKDAFKFARLLSEKIKKGRLRYMAEVSDMTKEDVLDYWKDKPFDLGIPEWLGNCVFCIKKSDLKLAAAQRDEPEMYLNWLEMVEGAPDRTKPEGRDSRHMYRGWRALDEVVARFDGSTGEEIKARMRGAKMVESGSCSESCEGFLSGD